MRPGLSGRSAPPARHRTSLVLHADHVGGTERLDARATGGEIAVNAALAMVGAVQPRNEIEGALAVQMACTHTAAMAVLARLGGQSGGERRVAARARREAFPWRAA
jgi:hypothetical protein